MVLSYRLGRSLNLKNQFGSSFDIVTIANIHTPKDPAILSLDIYTYTLQKCIRIFLVALFVTALT